MYVPVTFSWLNKHDLHSQKKILFIFYINNVINILFNIQYSIFCLAKYESQ